MIADPILVVDLYWHWRKIKDELNKELKTRYYVIDCPYSGVVAMWGEDLEDIHKIFSTEE